MSGAGSGYEINAFTFSPDGHLFQAEYAAKAVEKERIAIGVRCSDGVVFAAQKPLPTPLLRRGVNPRIYWVNTHIACATVGYRPDCYAGVVRARKEADRYHGTFGATIAVDELVSRVALSFHQAHALMSIRPYGCALLFGSFEDGRATLYALEPNGQFFGYFATCFGKDSTLARAELQRTDWGTKTVEEAARIVADIIRGLPQSQGQKNKWELEMMWVCRVSDGKPQAVPEALFQ
jgi:20S proteasome subunit alpha 7